MTEPKSHSKEDIYDFLIYCSNNKQINVWNNWRVYNQEDRIDLRGANLSGAYLNGAYLIEANLSRAHLLRANLRDAILLRADLRLANLRDADLSGAVLIDADLHGAILIGTDLSGAIGHERGNDSSIVTKEIELESQLQKKEAELKELKSTSDNQSQEYKTKLEKAESEVEKLKKEQATLTDGKKKKDEILKFISTEPSESLDAIKTMLEGRIKWFNSIGMVGMGVSVSVFFAYLYFLFRESQLPTSITQYISYVFFVAFPMLIAFMAYRQSNLKYKELETINDTIIRNQNI